MLWDTKKTREGEHPMGTIRFAQTADAAVLLSIYKPYVEETSISFEYEPPSLAEFTRRVEEIAAFYPYLIYEEAGEILGYAYGHRQMERAAYQWNAETAVYVDRSCRRRGIGAALYAALLPLLEAQGVRNVFGVVVGGNEGSIALHRRFGFSEAARFPASGYKQGQWWDTIWFGKTFGDGAPQPLRPIGEIPAAEILAQYQPD